MKLWYLVLVCAAFFGSGDGLSLQLASRASDGELEDSETTAAPGEKVMKTGKKVQDETDKQAGQLKREAQESIWKFRNFNLPAMARKDAYRIYDNFMPDFHYRPRSVKTLVIVCLLAVVWFMAYYDYLYKSDRTFYLQTDASMEDSLKDGLSTSSENAADLVIVLHHPEYEYSDKTREIDAAYLRRVFRDNDDLPLFKAEVEKVEKAGTRVLGSFGEAFTGEDSDVPTLQTLRVALLKDLCAAMPKWGLERRLWTSVDNDEFFMSVMLQKDYVSSYLARFGVDLQLSSQVVKELGIDQPEEECSSSPPYVRYEPTVSERLAQAKIITSPDDVDFYKNFFGRYKRGDIVSSRVRIAMLTEELNNHINLDLLKACGLVVDWYPAQSKSWLRKLRSDWANWTNLHDFTFQQPVLALREYFDSRVAFNFAWTGHYCKCLLALLPVSLTLEIGGKIAENVMGMDREQVENRVVLSSGLVIILWAKISWNMWCREEHFFMKLWGLDPEAPDKSIRADFKGEWKASIADKNIKEIETNQPVRDGCFRFLSALLTLIFCAAVQIWVIIWIDIFEGHMDLGASLCLTIQIKVFEFLFNAVVPKLVDIENRKYHTNYYNSYLWKNFLFQSVNSYSAFFYLAVKQRYTERGCPPGGCVSALHDQLCITQVILSISAVVEVLIASLIVKGRIWWEDRSYRTANDGQEPPERSFSEEQAKFSEYRLREQINHMTALMLSLGFILIFGSAAPRMVPFCLLVFGVRLRVCALMLVEYVKRPVPRMQFGIGLWSAILRVLMSVGVVMSGFLAVTFANFFEDTKLVTRLCGWILYVGGVYMIWKFVDIWKSQEDSDVTTLIARRSRVMEVLMQADDRASQLLSGKGTKAKNVSQMNLPGSGEKLETLLEQARYSEIPKMSQTPTHSPR
eukprot:TRINITY_DN11_c0_g1_i1.p1 TRINITY_DN11_c0_g1~~TRINITY_DN11_c0_g1_i1.p1  ORF type:complete len:911 (-),score=216.67 TRINITY_DN11_c0_g1_i1:96-2828(-)